MARNQNTFAKLQREADKKAKAQAKRLRRKQRKQHSSSETQPDPRDVEPQTEEGSN